MCLNLSQACLTVFLPILHPTNILINFLYIHFAALPQDDVAGVRRGFCLQEALEQQTFYFELGVLEERVKDVTKLLVELFHEVLEGFGQDVKMAPLDLLYMRTQ